MYRIGLSTCGAKPLDKQIFCGYKNAGISAMEISLPEGAHRTVCLPEVKRLSDEYGVELWSYHLPFSPFSEIDISSLESVKRTSSVRFLQELIVGASEIGINKFVVHPSAEPITERRRERLESAKESLCALAQTAYENNSVIAVENLPRTCLGRNSEEILELVGSDERLRVCFDTNHLLGEDPADFIKKTGEKIITVHVSDYDFLNERHWLPGEGSLKWDEIVKALEKAGYGGVWMYEVSLETPGTLHRDRKLIYSDFVKNANEIFSGNKPTAFSVPVPGLKSWLET